MESMNTIGVPAMVRATKISPSTRSFDAPTASRP